MSNEQSKRVTLLIDTHTELESLLSLNLKTWVDSDTLYQTTAQGALGLISKTPKLDLIIAIARRGHERTAEIINNYLIDHERPIPLLVVGESSIENSDRVEHIENAIDIKPFIKACAKLLDVTARDMANIVIPQYYGVQLEFFNTIKYSAVELYYLNENENSYEILSLPNTYFEEGLISQQIEAGKNELYVKKNDRLTFVQNATQEFISLIDLDTLGENEQVSAQESTHELLKFKLAQFGINEETVALSQKHLKDIATHVKKHPTLKLLLAKMINNKTSYLFKHIQILTFIGNHVLSHIDWGNQEQIEKFGFIAFFHDIMLENDEQAQIRNRSDMKKTKLNEKQIELVNTHAQKAAELVHKYPKAPMGVDIIIRQHHGVTHGVGFSETFSTNISPMAIVFILSEELAGHIISSGTNFSTKEKIAELREKYTTQRFKKVIDLFETLAT